MADPFRNRSRRLPKGNWPHLAHLARLPRVFLKTGANNRGVWTAMTQASRQTARDTPTVEPKPNKGWNTKRERRASNQLLLAAPKQN